MHGWPGSGWLNFKADGESMTGGQNGKHGMNDMQIWMEYCKIIEWDVKQNPWIQGWLIADALNKGDSMTLPHKIGLVWTIKTWVNNDHSWWKLAHGMTSIKRAWTSKYKCLFMMKFDFERQQSGTSWKNGFLLKCQIIKKMRNTHYRAQWDLSNIANCSWKWPMV